jgi:tRNA pseudouridine38-40 synthase
MSVMRLTVEYDGSGFHGWQRQPGERTVEGVLRAALAAIGEGGVALTAAGRTDSGAHAHGQVAGVTLRRPWPPERLRAALNAHLPEDVVVVDTAAAGDAFHARFDALRRTYRYLVVTRAERAAVVRRHAWTVRGPLDVETMQAAAEDLVGTHDFAAFGRPTWSGGTTVRTVHEARVDRVSVRAADVTRVDGVVITVTADAFLRGMMRGIAGALVAVGRGELTVAAFAALVRGGAHATARLTVAPAHGLHQWSVTYRDERPGSGSSVSARARSQGSSRRRARVGELALCEPSASGETHRVWTATPRPCPSRSADPAANVEVAA